MRINCEGKNVLNQQEVNLWLILAVCIYLNLLDLLATLSVGQLGGWEAEANPIMRYFFTLDPLVGALVKLTAVLFFVVIIQYAAQDHFKLAYRGSALVTIIYTVLLGWHLFGQQFMEAKKSISFLATVLIS